ncbi:MAG: hypothetical protein A3B86_01470 [Candidatus Yanofskybacteria bacterium RIFCSPHIGHO2_02_FULL_38_22b]|uniref:Uncharacterized protein n=1 Tax=Candidatus Yanofskybacteria bacterium RIFCSPHIGHO2_02_FULL_38_22b TaxID=1802673 RepID=A0A1F8F565_9BACT|nr:MAG: hypothetical protein A3B86_01470 [Candidatus Yanofskybacteria bacterium RIFCSPHIGHO2_02_FULL_38_22b]OGN20481.1 MAG: hypothetical protein A2910_02330 [Candidatus Yanofskybacteria bacterium RIFCSPLOWO2_01_FULL_39_28]
MDFLLFLLDSFGNVLALRKKEKFLWQVIGNNLFRIRKTSTYLVLIVIAKPAPANSFKAPLAQLFGEGRFVL